MASTATEDIVDFKAGRFPGFDGFDAEVVNCVIGAFSQHLF